MSKTWDSSGEPRAVIHKRILDVAGDNPDASLADIAAEISGANADLVDRVLSKYGDPGETELQNTDTEMSHNGQQSGERAQKDAQPDETSDDAGQVEPVTDPDDLTEKQLQTVRAVYEETDATQGDIADRLGVTPATVSRRLGDIPGFEWSDRAAFTETLFDGTEYEGDASAADVTETEEPESTGNEADSEATADETVSDDESAGHDSDSSTDEDRTEPALDSLEARLATVEEMLDSDTDTSERPIRRELAHKVVHAAMESERISEEEELEVIAGLLD
jgi:transcriptional regulator with XRE-family HTH domain